jgi:hypothetical protein
MPKLRIGFSDESELNLELEFETEEQQNEYIDKCINDHLSTRPDVYETGRMWTSDVLAKKPDDLAKKDEEEIEDAVTYDPNQESLDFRAEDTEYFQNKLVAATKVVDTGVLLNKDNEVVYTCSTADNEDLTNRLELTKHLEKVKAEREEETGETYTTEITREHVGTLKGKTADEFVEFVNRFDIERSVMELKYGTYDYGVAFDSKVEDITEEKLVNIIGNLPRPLFATFNEKSQRFECMVIMRDALVAIVSPTKAGALLRGLIVMRSGKLHNNHDLSALLLKCWQEANGVKENPLIPSSNVLKKLIEDAGTSVEEIDAEYKEMVAKAKQSTKVEE